MSADIQVNSELLSDFLSGLLHRQIEASANDWFTQKLAQLKSKPQTKDLYLTFSAIPRYLGKHALQLSAADLEQANVLRQGFNPEGWSAAQAARVLTICSFHFDNSESYLKILDQLFNSAEVTELVALYSALPLLPYPEKLKNRASEGIRTNMSVVFDAVVLNNPYPADYLDEGPWNQMVLKALFMERPLYQIQGLERRSNARLTKMISNYAHERWAAGRSTSPEMWRPIGDQDTIGIYQDLEKLVSLEDTDQQEAAVLTAQALGTKEAQAFLDHHQPMVDRVSQQGVTWDKLGQRWWASKNQN